MKNSTEPTPITASELAEIADKVGLLHLDERKRLLPMWLDGVDLMPHMQEFANELNKRMAKRSHNE